MTNLTNKNIDFLSDREVIDILLSVLNELDLVASVGGHRSTTYLAVSGVEGLFSEILRLKQITSGNKAEDLALREKYNKLSSAGVLSKDFQSLFEPLIRYRNYLHLNVEKDEQSKLSITQSVAQRALSALNSLIEDYQNLRFIAGQEWRLEYGIAQVPDNKTIYMPPNPGDHVSLLISEQPASHFKTISFDVIIPRNTIFNFIYNFQSMNNFAGTRIEGREASDGKGYDSGRFRCVKWRAWPINARYVTEPSPAKQRHSVQIILNPHQSFKIVVDDVELVLEDNMHWGFHKNKKIGFMTELGLVSIFDLKVELV
jgi:hypothetical protein